MGGIPNDKEKDFRNDYEHYEAKFYDSYSRSIRKKPYLERTDLIELKKRCGRRRQRDKERDEKRRMIKNDFQ